MLAEKLALEGFVKKQQREMERSQANIVSLSALTEYSIIDHKHCTSLKEPYGEKTTTALLEWLGLHDSYEQVSNHLIHELNIKNEHNRIEWNEEEEEEERRRYELDMEEEDFFHPSVIQRPETVTMSHTTIESLPRNNNNNKRKKADDSEQLVRNIVENRTTLTDETVQQLDGDIWILPMEDRYNLYRYWLFKYRQYLQNSIAEKSQEYDEAASSLAEHRQEEDYHILKGSIIVAMTTTCAAKYHKLLQKLREKIILNFAFEYSFCLFLESKIVIVEEAAAIFEAHIITALNTKCEHLILIGDHIQLRPNPSVYRLAVKYNIDVSLFERLIKNKFPNVRLNIQVRFPKRFYRLSKRYFSSIVCAQKSLVL